MQRASKYDDDQIDLFKLLALLWEEKFLIIAITFLTTLIPVWLVYSKSVPYLAVVRMAPPAYSDVSELEKFFSLYSTPTSKVDVTARAYGDFLNVLKSTEFLEEFLRDEELRRLVFKDGIDSRAALVELEGMVSINVPDGRDLTSSELTFQANDPELAANVANELVRVAINTYRNRIEADRAAAIEIEKSKLKTQILILYEALEIASRLGYKHRQQATFTSSRSSNHEIGELYLRGTDELESIIDVLEARQKAANSSSVKDGLQNQIGFPTLGSFDASKIMPLIIERSPVSGTKAKPNYKRVVLPSFFGGGFLAILIVLIRDAFRKRIQIM